MSNGNRGTWVYSGSGSHVGHPLVESTTTVEVAAAPRSCAARPSAPAGGEFQKSPVGHGGALESQSYATAVRKTMYVIACLLSTTPGVQRVAEGDGEVWALTNACLSGSIPQVQQMAALGVVPVSARGKTQCIE